MFYSRANKIPNYLQHFTLYQKHLLYFYANILLFGSFLNLLSLKKNQISSSNLMYAFTILTSFLIVGGYFLYYVFWVLRAVESELYKINNLLRVVSLMLIVYGEGNGQLVLNLVEVAFIGIEIACFER
jgi:hypothetical protein